MGHSQADKAKTHKRIVAINSKRFREDGLAGVGIAELMKEAGLTVGRFYKHFTSRDALVAEAEREAALAVERAIYVDLFPVVPKTGNRNNRAVVNQGRKL